MTQRNVRGAYVTFEHDRAADWDWLAKWQPNVIRYLAPGKPEDPASLDVNRVKRIHDTCPEATILLRCWELDDRNFAAHDAMVADPHAEADRQVDWWASVFNRAGAVGVPRHLLMAGLNNETGPEKDGALYPYTEWALKYGIKQEVRLGVFVFSVGRPSLPGEAEWTIDSFAKLEPLIKANNGAIVLHSYMQPEGMYAVWTDEEGKERKDWTYLMGRDLRWPTSVPIIIGEWGIDGILYNRHPDPHYGNSGWTNFDKDWPPSRYADEYVECIRQANPNVIAICPFISDWSDHKWQSFDLIEAYGEFLARKDLCVRDDAPPPAPTTPMWVNVPNGANLRTLPTTKATIKQSIPYAEKVDSFGQEITEGAVWNHVIADNERQGWILGALLSPTKPSTPTPTTGTGPTEPVKPTPTGDKWQRTINFILGEEGGFTANDEGNPANFGINQGANPDLDVAHITREQAVERYRTGYWLASTADQYPWPFCLLIMDAAVQHGEGEARMLLKASKGNMLHFQGARQLYYANIEQGNWNRNGKAWMARMGRLLLEASKP